MNKSGFAEMVRASWRRELERRALKIRSIPLYKLLHDLADPEKAHKHHRICVELARRSLHRGMTVTLKSGKSAKIYEVRDDGYFYLRKGALSLFADIIDWPRMFSAEPNPPPPPTEETNPDLEERRRKQREIWRRWKARQDPEALRRKRNEQYRKWKKCQDPEALRRYWREKMRACRARQDQNELRRKKREAYYRWKANQDPEELHRQWRESNRQWRAKKKAATSAGK